MINFQERTMTRARIAIVMALLLSLGLLGCDSSPQAVKIGEVVQKAASFEGHEVKLQGTASQAIKIPLVEAKAYRLKDATGEVLVWTSGDLPKEGEEVVVRGQVENIAVIAGQSYGLTVREIERRPPGIRWPWQ
jgi:cytochrome c-type biogenesis protein CcmE